MRQAAENRFGSEWWVDSLQEAGIDLTIIDYLRLKTAPNKKSILTPDAPRVEILMTIQPSTQKSERALGQA